MHFFQVSIKLAHPFPAPELRTRILRTLKDFSESEKVRKPARPLQRSLGPLRARNAEKVSKMSPGASGPKSPKSLGNSLRRVSGESPESLERVFLDCFQDFLETYTSKNVKNRQTVSKSFSTLFDNFRAGQKTSEIVKKTSKSFSTLFDHFRVALFFRPLLGGSDEGEQKRHQNLAPVLVIIWGEISGIFQEKIICAGFQRCCAPTRP